MSVWNALLSLPWREVTDSEGDISIVNSLGDEVAGYVLPHASQAILKAVSCHEEMVSALEGMLHMNHLDHFAENSAPKEAAEAALAHAKEP